MVPVKWFYPLVLALFACGVVILIRLGGIILVLALLTISPSMLAYILNATTDVGFNTAMFCNVIDWIDHLLLRRYKYQRSNFGVAIATYLTKTLIELARNRLSTNY